MPRELSVVVNGKVSQKGTQPLLMLEIPFSYYVRYITGDTQTWDAKVFVQRGFTVSGLTWDGRAQQNVSVTVDDQDGSLTTLALSEGLAGRQVKLWLAYVGGLQVDGPVAMFEGVGDEAEFDIENGQVKFTAVGESITALFSPRRFISKPDFNFLPPAGTVITVNNQTFRLARSGE